MSMKRRPNPSRSGYETWAPMATPLWTAADAHGAQRRRVAGVEAARHVGARDDLEHRLVVAELPHAEGLAEVTVQVDRHHRGERTPRPRERRPDAHRHAPRARRGPLRHGPQRAPFRIGSRSPGAGCPVNGIAPTGSQPPARTSSSLPMPHAVTGPLGVPRRARSGDGTVHPGRGAATARPGRRSTRQPPRGEEVVEVADARRCCR